MPETIDAETRARLLLHLVSGIGPKTTLALLERFGSAERITRCTISDLQSVPNIGSKTATQLVEAFRSIDVEKELSRVTAGQTSIFHHGAEGFPAKLREIPASPMILYVKGRILPEDERAIAIVGSRKCTAYGKRMTERLTRDFVRAGYTIVSGLARGIDGVAHTTALEAGGRTLAVLAGGLSKLYPPEHKQLAEQVIAHGALISEMPMDMSPLPDMFPRRNRIISGLSRGVIIVEAAQRSGALVTARHATEQGRDVFAIPGPVDSEASEGPNELIRKGATLVRSAEDVFEFYQDQDIRIPAKLASTATSTNKEATPSLFPAAPPPSLTEKQRLIWENIDSQGTHVDELISKTSLSIMDLNTDLMMMELTGHLRRLPGNRFVRRP